MPEARFEVALPPAPAPEGLPCGPGGAEAPEFLLCANKGERLQPLREVASGGELSRAFLALKQALREQAAGMVLVFDEVDAGVGGEAAERVGQRLAELAERHQVLCITHLPQIAAYAHRHFRVAKQAGRGAPASSIAPVTGDERVDEIARMAGGDQRRRRRARVRARADRDPRGVAARRTARSRGAPGVRYLKGASDPRRCNRRRRRALPQFVCRGSRACTRRVPMDRGREPREDAARAGARGRIDPRSARILRGTGDGGGSGLDGDRARPRCRHRDRRAHHVARARGDRLRRRALLRPGPRQHERHAREREPRAEGRAAQRRRSAAGQARARRDACRAERGGVMDTLSLIVVSDDTRPVRRFELRKVLLKRAAIGAGVFAVTLLGLAIDYVRLRIDNRELASLRKETRGAPRAGGGVREEDGRGRRPAREALRARAQGADHREPARLGGVGRRRGHRDRARGRARGPGRARRAVRERRPARRHSSRLPVIPDDAGVPERVSLLDQSADYLGAIAQGQGDSLEELLALARGQARAARVVAFDLALARAGSRRASATASRRSRTASSSTPASTSRARRAPTWSRPRVAASCSRARTARSATA